MRAIGLARFIEWGTTVGSNFMLCPTLRLKEIENIDMSSFRTPQYATIQCWEKSESVKFKTINLHDQKESDLYFAREWARLKELEGARVELANLIKKYYEPHHIL